LGGLGATYDVHVRFIGKRIVDLLLVSIELFSLGVTAEALRAKIDRKLAGGSVSTKFLCRRGRPSPITFARRVRPMHVADSFHTKKLCSRLSSSEVQFYTENGHFAF